MIETIRQRVSRIPYHIWKLASYPHLGRHESRQRGSGLAFDQLTEYHPGEEIRRINWAATARRGGTSLLVNTYYEERDTTVVLLVDLSASMDFGSTRLTKKALTAEISASLVYSALAAGDRVGLLGFTSQVACYMPPRQARAYQRTIPEAILHVDSDRATVNFQAVVEGLEKRITDRALVFLLSDFLTDDVPQLSQALSWLRRRHDLIALVVTDPREVALPVGNTRLAIRDRETGKTMWYSFSRRNRRHMAATEKARRAQLQQMLHGLGIAHVTVTPHSHYGEDLTHLFRTRRRRRCA